MQLRATADNTIILKSAREIAIMREAGAVVSAVIQALQEQAEPGMTTRDLDEIAARMFAEAGAESTALGYFGYPGHICVSVNDEVVHGIPGQPQAQAGRSGQGRRRGALPRLRRRPHARLRHRRQRGALRPRARAGAGDRGGALPGHRPGAPGQPAERYRRRHRAARQAARHVRGARFRRPRRRTQHARGAAGPPPGPGRTRTCCCARAW